MRQEERENIEQLRINEKQLVNRCVIEVQLGSVGLKQIEDWFRINLIPESIVQRLANKVRDSL